MEFKEVEAKSILVPCKIPGIDYVINPYTGCRFGCIYCYASFMGRFVGGKDVKDWGNYVYAKVNAPDLLRKEMKKKFGKDKGENKEILISSVTDPYQGMETKYKLTRKCLEVISDFGFKGTVSILTKSDLVLRDIDVLKKIQNIFMGVTVTSTDDGISRFFEKYAPNVSDRFKALKILNENNISTYAFIGPLLPHFVANEEELEKIFQKLSEVGTKDIFVEHLNLSKYIKDRLLAEMKGADREVVEKFYLSQSKSYREALDDLVGELVSKYNMNLMLDMVIFHKEFQRSVPLRNLT